MRKKIKINAENAIACVFLCNRRRENLRSRCGCEDASQSTDHNEKMRKSQIVVFHMKQP